MMYDMTNMQVLSVAEEPNVTLCLKIVSTNVNVQSGARIDKESCPAIRYGALRQAYHVLDLIIHRNACSMLTATSGSDSASAQGWLKAAPCPLCFS